jgi:hypothetical protein
LQINRFGAPPSGRPPRKDFKYKNEVQCTACKTFGHDIKLNVCRFCAQYHHSSKYATKFPDETLKNASAFASAQDKAKVNKAKVSFPNLFHPDMTEDDEMNALAQIAIVMYPDKQEEWPQEDKPPRPPKPRDPDIKIMNDGTLPDTHLSGPSEPLHKALNPPDTDDSAQDSDDDSSPNMDSSDQHLYNPLTPPPFHLAPFLLDDPQNHDCIPIITPLLHPEITRKITQVQMDHKKTTSIFATFLKSSSHINYRVTQAQTAGLPMMSLYYGIIDS